MKDYKEKTKGIKAELTKLASYAPNKESPLYKQFKAFLDQGNVVRTMLKSYRLERKDKDDLWIQYKGVDQKLKDKFNNISKKRRENLEAYLDQTERIFDEADKDNKGFEKVKERQKNAKETMKKWGLLKEDNAKAWASYNDLKESMSLDYDIMKEIVDNRLSESDPYTRIKDIKSLRGNLYFTSADKKQMDELYQTLKSAQDATGKEIGALKLEKAQANIARWEKGINWAEKKIPNLQKQLGELESNQALTDEIRNNCIEEVKAQLTDAFNTLKVNQSKIDDVKKKNNL